MFQSIILYPRPPKLIDDEFECIVELPETIQSGSVIVGVIICKAYSQRKLNVGKNLAVGIIWWNKRNDINMEYIISIQNHYCPNYVNNWEQYAEERNRYLKKFLIWK